MEMQKYYFITHDNHDAEFNLASEEYLLKQTEGYYFYLWINAPAVIVGVNQNALQEVNLSYTESNGIKVVRRLTGGGAVYHDLGNLCYTVIAPYDDKEDNYKKFTAPVIEYLNSIGVNATFSGRNDITVDGKKISGNAQTVYKNRIMHHGTILFDTDFTVLEKALNPNKLKMESKGIKSVRARVINVKEKTDKVKNVEQFKDGLEKVFLRSCEKYEFTEKDLIEIKKLVDEKYSRYEWNIGRSPKGKNEFSAKFSFGVLTLNFDTENGVIKNAELFGDFFTLKDLTPLIARLEGVRLNKIEMEKALLYVGEYIKGANAKDIVEEMF